MAGRVIAKGGHTKTQTMEDTQTEIYLSDHANGKSRTIIDISGPACGVYKAIEIMKRQCSTGRFKSKLYREWHQAQCQ